MFRGLAIALVLALAAAVGVGVYVAAGRGAPPALSIDKPDRAVGQRSTLEISAVVPRARLTNLTITLEQNGRTVPLFSLDAPQSSAVTDVDANHLRVVRPFGKLAVPETRPRAAARPTRCGAKPGTRTPISGTGR